MEELLKIVINRTQINPLHTSSRKIEVIDARAALANVIRRCYRVKLTEIGRQLNMHHTTVMHHIKHHENRYVLRQEYRELYDELVDYASFGYVVDEEVFEKIKSLCI